MQASLARSASWASASDSFVPGVSSAHHVSLPNSNSVTLDPYGETDFRGVPSSEASFAASVDFPVCEGPSTVKQRIGDPPIAKSTHLERNDAFNRVKVLDICCFSRMPRVTPTRIFIGTPV
jgi:hypothetical protein